MIDLCNLPNVVLMQENTDRRLLRGLVFFCMFIFYPKKENVIGIRKEELKPSPYLQVIPEMRLPKINNS